VARIRCVVRGAWCVVRGARCVECVECFTDKQRRATATQRAFCKCRARSRQVDFGFCLQIAIFRNFSPDFLAAPSSRGSGCIFIFEADMGRASGHFPRLVLVRNRLSAQQTITTTTTDDNGGGGGGGGERAGQTVGS
jgi:hypothetical protein